MDGNKAKVLSEHFRHELEMLYESKRFRPKDKIQESFRLEIFLLHARNLYEFFYKGKPNSREHTDMRVYDYVKNWQEKPFPDKKGSEWFDEVSQRLAHFTVLRNKQRKLIRKKFLSKVYSCLVDNCDTFMASVNFKGKNRLLNLSKVMKK